MSPVLCQIIPDNSLASSLRFASYPPIYAYVFHATFSSGFPHKNPDMRSILLSVCHMYCLIHPVFFLISN